jgi:DNA-binding NtrC family response regulator
MNSNKPVIVIAEDSRVQGKVLQQRLIAAGYDAHLGANGELALELVKNPESGSRGFRYRNAQDDRIRALQRYQTDN